MVENAQSNRWTGRARSIGCPLAGFRFLLGECLRDVRKLGIILVDTSPPVAAGKILDGRLRLAGNKSAPLQEFSASADRNYN